MAKAKCGIKKSRNIKKMHAFLFSRGMGKENVAVHKKCLLGKQDAIFVWFVGDLFGIWLVFGWFGWFVGVLWVVWLVCEWNMGCLTGLWVVWIVCGWVSWLWVVSSFTIYTAKLTLRGGIYTAKLKLGGGIYTAKRTFFDGIYAVSSKQ